MKILILGGKGFIGRHIFKNLNGENITHFNRNNETNLYEIKDLIKLLEIDYDYIIICSGSNIKNSSSLYRSSVLNVQTILNNYSGFEKTKVIFLSSNVTEYTTEYPFPYQNTKILCENLLIKSKFKSVVIFRIPIIEESENFKVIKFLSRFLNFDSEYNYLVALEDIRKKLEKHLIENKEEILTEKFHDRKIYFKDFNSKIKFPIIKVKTLEKVLFGIKAKGIYNKFKVFYGYK